MITQTDIETIYREDQQRPYYSIQGGRRIKRLSRLEKQEEWIWGHFQEALANALKEINVTGMHSTRVS